MVQHREGRAAAVIALAAGQWRFRRGDQSPRCQKGRGARRASVCLHVKTAEFQSPVQP